MMSLFRRALLAVPFLLAAPFFLAACGGASSENGAASAEPAKTEDPAKIENHAGADMVLGDPNAAVTVIEYASVTCPHCATFHEMHFPALKAKYIDTGKVKFVFREFPTAPAQFSYIGSVLARCAADKGGTDAYFAVLGNLFRTQRTWIYGDDPKAELLKIAGQVGMDEAGFDTCLKRQELIDLINANVKEGSEEYEITGTPAFIVDGEKATLKQLEDLDAAIDAALAKAAG